MSRSVSAMRLSSSRAGSSSAEHGEAALLGQFVERPLHDVPDVGVDLVDVGVLAELRDDVDRLAAPA